MNRWLTLISVSALALFARSGFAMHPEGAIEPVTTVITHGFQLSTTSKPDWMLAMGQQVLVAAGGQGSILRYLPASGQWQLAGGAAPSAGAPLVLLFNWADESDGASIPGANLGYSQAAADALYAAMRAPSGALGFSPVTGRLLHFIGHSRGCCVNSEVALRLANAGIPVDQVTTLDPHPVAPPMSESCGLGGNVNWGDTVPVRWANVSWADNYWRADTGLAGACHDCDFDGMALPAAQVSNTSLFGPLGEQAGDLDDCLFGCRLEHSKTHTWYHGTIAGATTDPDCGVNATGTWYLSAEAGCNSWSCAGYAHSAAAGGARAALGPGVEPIPTDLLCNGGFELGYSGWSFHGGGGLATVALETGTPNHYLRLEPTKPSRKHNRFYLPRNASELHLDLRVFTASTDDLLRVRLVDDAGVVHPVASIALATPTTAWVAGPAIPFGPEIARGVAYRIEFAVESQAGSLTAIAGVDDAKLLTAGPAGPLGDLNGDDLVNGADLGILLGSWGACGGASCAADLDGDGSVGGADLGLLLGGWTG